MQWLETTRKTGRRSLKIFRGEPTFSVFTAGRKFWILALSKVLGQRKRTGWFCYLSKRKALKSGHKLLPISTDELESNVESAGTTIWIQWLRKIHGAKKRSGFSTYVIDNMVTLGLILLKSCKDALTTQSKITGTQACERNFMTSRRNSKFRLESIFRQFATKNIKDVASNKRGPFHRPTGHASNKLRTAFYWRVKRLLINKTRFTMRWRQESY